MIEVVSAEHPQFRKGRQCLFKTKLDYETVSSDEESAEGEKVRALFTMQIASILQWFVKYPCELDFTIGVSQGKAVCQGQVKAYTDLSHACAVAILEEVAIAAANFVMWFPAGEYKMKVRQTILEAQSYPHVVH